MEKIKKNHLKNLLKKYRAKLLPINSTVALQLPMLKDKNSVNVSCEMGSGKRNGLERKKKIKRKRNKKKHSWL